METSSNINDLRSNSLPGDPNCPICHGIGFVRKDLPITDPDFGQVILCSCMQVEFAQAKFKKLHRLSNLDELHDKTFETFRTEGRVGVGERQIQSLHVAFRQSMQFARELNGWLIITGSYGCGKTHLAAAIGNYAVNNGVDTIFLTIPDLLDWLRLSFISQNATYENRFEEIKNVQLLVLDDLGTENATAWALEKLYQVINYRYIKRLPTVITTNLDLARIDDRISSRMQDTELALKVSMDAPDYRNPMKDSRSQLSSLHLYTDCTFGTFRLRESERLPPEEQTSLEKAFQAAHQFAEKPDGWLILMGTYGCGKTHLAASIANYRLSLGDEPLFVVVPELLDHLRATFSPESHISYDNLFNQVISSSLLIMDDLGTESATPWAREKLYQIINFRYAAKLPTVLTTTLKFSEIDERIRSRMSDTRLCKIYAILAPSYRSSGEPAHKPARRRSQK